MMKLMIWIGLTVGGTIGGLIGAALSDGNPFSVLSIALSTVGSLAGIWAGYVIARDYL